MSMVLGALVAVLRGWSFASLGSTLSPSTSVRAQSRIARRASRFDAPSDLKPPMGAEKTDSGLAFKVLEAGEGPSPSGTANVKVHYTGWMQSNGQMFDSSYLKNQPVEFKLNEVIAGWTEGVSMMQKGETRRLWIPGELAYGPETGGSTSGAPLGDLVFDVKLIEYEEEGAGFLIYFAYAGAFLFFLTFLYNSNSSYSVDDGSYSFGYKPMD